MIGSFSRLHRSGSHFDIICGNTAEAEEATEEKENIQPHGSPKMKRSY